jgi:beta-lactam-binding protein with PASTA domain
MQLVPGQYTVRASAPGFTPATDAATIPGTTALTLTMAPANPIMPDVFGQTLAAALAGLATRSIVVSRVVDVTGRDIAPASPDAEFRDSPVLLQRPAAGQPVLASTGAQLVVAASLRIEPSVEMPSLTGLTLDEVRTVLEDLGLVLGDVSTRRSD